MCRGEAGDDAVAYSFKICTVHFNARHHIMRYKMARFALADMTQTSLRAPQLPPDQTLAQLLCFAHMNATAPPSERISHNFRSLSLTPAKSSVT